MLLEIQDQIINGMEDTNETAARFLLAGEFENKLVKEREKCGF